MLRCLLSLTLLLSPRLGLANEAQEAQEAQGTEVVSSETDSEPQTATQTLELARLAIKQGRYFQARNLLITLPEPWEPRSREEANYLLAYTFEKNGESERAKLLYDAGLSRWPDGARRRDTLFRLAESSAADGNCYHALRQLKELSTETLTTRDQHKIAINTGGCWLAQKRTSKGLRLIEQTLEQMQPSELVYYQAKAHAHLTQLLFEESRALSFQVRQRRQLRRLTKRARLIGQAERHVITIVKLEEPEWIVRGLLTLGDAYEQTALALLAARPPRRLSDEQEALFHRALQGQVETLLIKAIRHYERGLDVIMRLQWNTLAKAKLEQQLQRARLRVETLGSTPSNQP